MVYASKIYLMCPFLAVWWIICLGAVGNYAVELLCELGVEAKRRC